MSPNNIKYAKEITPLTHYRAYIKDWKLSFSLSNEYEITQNVGWGNIHYEKGNKCHGVLLEISNSDCDKLASNESSYRLQTVEAHIYKDDIMDNISKIHANVFIFDLKQQNKINNEIKNGSGNIRRVFNAKCIPHKNYLNTLIVGAIESQLDQEYINWLKNINYSHELKYNPTIEQLNLIHSTTWNTINEIEEYNSLHNKHLYVLKGIALDSDIIGKHLKGNNIDITMNTAKRWAFTNKNNLNDLTALHWEQKAYINHELQHFMNGAWRSKIVGKLNDSEINGFGNYDW